jgi:hypothetical protein
MWHASWQSAHLSFCPLRNQLPSHPYLPTALPVMSILENAHHKFGINTLNVDARVYQGGGSPRVLAMVRSCDLSLQPNESSI